MYNSSHYRAYLSKKVRNMSANDMFHAWLVALCAKHAPAISLPQDKNIYFVRPLDEQPRAVLIAVYKFVREQEKHPKWVTTLRELTASQLPDGLYLGSAWGAADAQVNHDWLDYDYVTVNLRAPVGGMAAVRIAVNHLSNKVSEAIAGSFAPYTVTSGVFHGEETAAIVLSGASDIDNLALLTARLPATGVLNVTLTVQVSDGVARSRTVTAEDSLRSVVLDMLTEPNHSPAVKETPAADVKHNILNRLEHERDAEAAVRDGIEMAKYLLRQVNNGNIPPPSMIDLAIKRLSGER